MALILNPEPRTPVLFLLDRSSSMSDDPIDQLNDALKLFVDEVREDAVARLRVEPCIWSFGEEVRKEHDWATIDEFETPTLVARGHTPMAEAIQRGLDDLETRKEVIKSQGIPRYRAWVILITDGAPTDDEGVIDEAIRRVQEGLDKKAFILYAIGVSGADFTFLGRLCRPAEPPIEIESVDFGELFRWLSASMAIASREAHGSMKRLPPPVGQERSSM